MRMENITGLDYTRSKANFELTKMLRELFDNCETIEDVCNKASAIRKVLEKLK